MFLIILEVLIVLICLSLAFFLIFGEKLEKRRLHRLDNDLACLKSNIQKYIESDSPIPDNLLRSFKSLEKRIKRPSLYSLIMPCVYDFCSIVDNFIHKGDKK